jgi:hypothetical protein
MFPLCLPLWLSIKCGLSAGTLTLAQGGPGALRTTRYLNVARDFRGLPPAHEVKYLLGVLLTTVPQGPTLLVCMFVLFMTRVAYM